MDRFQHDTSGKQTHRLVECKHPLQFMVKLDVVTLLVRTLNARCKVGFPLSLQGPGEMKPLQQWTELGLLGASFSAIRVHTETYIWHLQNIQGWCSFSVWDSSDAPPSTASLAMTSHLWGWKDVFIKNHQTHSAVSHHLCRRFSFIKQPIRTDSLETAATTTKGQQNCSSS